MKLDKQNILILFKSPNKKNLLYEVEKLIIFWNFIYSKPSIMYKQSKLTVLRSPFIYKKSREQFEKTYCQAKMNFKLSQSNNISFFINKLLLRNINFKYIARIQNKKISNSF